MTAMVTDRPQMLVEKFEELAELAPRAGEGIRLEFINGKLGAKPMPDGDHDEIYRWLLEQVIVQRRDLFPYPEIGLKVDAYRSGRARTDAVIAPKGAFVGAGEWKDPGPVLMVVEVTSFDSDTDRRDRVEKPRAYAEAEIPVYLLIDREICELLAYSEPENGVYTKSVRHPFGKSFDVPKPVGITLDTEPLQGLVR
ncbi:Uma2 family endonuclease [Nocardia sp. BMG51109]|uniref:Uma2 family endonuclease n=1 Tax=Nocardia sp. BMG51109 TaxID=1056816 RepID=UPI0004667F80|nr:Uma2 family endonuclease [Nocardia sp. BMG51109]